MAKKSYWLADYAVYLAVRLVVALVQALGRRSALALARALAWLAYRIDRRHRAVADENLRAAFPDLQTDARDHLIRACYLHWMKVLVEMIRLPRELRRSNHDDHFHFAGANDLECGLAWLNSGRPLLLVTGHFGNFEALSYALGQFGARGAVVARRLDNPYLDRFLRDFRQKTGQVLLDKNGDYERILHTLATGGHLGVVGDQDAGARGLFVDFFGRPASTFKSVALLSLEHQAPILVMGAARVGELSRFVLYFEDVILPEDYAASPDATRAITQRFTAALERMARRHPEQYFWLHRRWKHQPRARQTKQAA